MSLSLVIWTFIWTSQHNWTCNVFLRHSATVEWNNSWMKPPTVPVSLLESNTCIVPSVPNVNDPCLCNTHGNSSGHHLAISFDVNAMKPSGVRKTTMFRRLRQISVSDFMTDIASLSDLLVDEPVGEMVEAYDTVTLRPNSSWYTDELRR